MHDRLLDVYERFREWVFGYALPLWAGVGGDGPQDHPMRFGAHESLHLDGTPACPGFKRLRVQARQLYVFSRAALYGWPYARESADSLYHFMKRAETSPGRWAKCLTPSGDILDSTVDLYDMAFVMFALSWYGRLEGRAHAIDDAERALLWLSGHMRGPGGGFLNKLPDDGAPRQQNPHMHLLEAGLALYETRPGGAARGLVHELLTLFEWYLFCPQTGTLGEFFSTDWQPLDGPQGDWVEPGHHYEWVWLLGEYRRLFHDRRFDTHQRALYDFNARHGLAPGSGVVYDALSRSGRVVRASSRLWAQTEALRAEISLCQSDVSPIITVVGNLLKRYFQGCPAGAWVDQLDAGLNPFVDKIPTSSLYHIMAGYAEFDHFIRQINPDDANRPPAF